jgi:hypothetical protein
LPWGLIFILKKLTEPPSAVLPTKFPALTGENSGMGAQKQLGFSGPSLSGIDRSTGFDKSAYSVLLPRTTVVIILLFKLKRQKSYNPLFNTEK